MLFKSPIVQFALIGVLLWAVQSWRAAPPPEQKIVISQSRLNTLAKRFQARHHRKPSPQELHGEALVFADEEARVREALQLGLQRDDPIIRRRLVQLSEIMDDSQFAESAITDDALKSYFKGHAENYRREPSISFHHYFYRTEAHARAARAALAAGAGSWDHGAAFPSGPDFNDIGRSVVARLFGEHFAKAVFMARTSIWTGPIKSSLGWHLIYVEHKKAAQIPRFDSVKLRVRHDYAVELKQKDAAQRQMARRERYPVVLPRIISQGEQP